MPIIMAMSLHVHDICHDISHDMVHEQLLLRKCAARIPTNHKGARSAKGPESRTEKKFLMGLLGDWDNESACELACCATTPWVMDSRSAFFLLP
jgi:hypothetical protein